MDSVFLMKQGAVGIITLNNPPMNVATLDVVRHLAKCVEEVEQDNEIRSVVLTTAMPKAFMAGADIKNFSECLKAPDLHLTLVDECNVAFTRLEALHKPVIAATQGLVFGAGVELTLVCDIRIADAGATFCLPEIKLGLFPGGGGSQRLPRLIGKSRAKKMIYTGESITAKQALEWGLVDEVTQKGEAEKTAFALAKTLAEFSSKTMASVKKAIDTGIDLPLKEGRSLEAEQFLGLFANPDTQEGILAFLEKRAPKFNI
ncbi:enoyl-CoA hydratase-related protein [Lachnospiraceae bacterium ZAX-1]